MNGLKVVVIGGGSSYTPEIIDGLITRAKKLPIDNLCLVDVEVGKEKLEIIGALAERMFKKAGLTTKVTLTLDRRSVLPGADFVITQFRVGCLEARMKDELFPLKYNVLGQETTGPGGFAKAMRTIPVILDICRDMEELCPAAWLINFTNPAGLITEAVHKYSKVKCIGLCNVPINMVMTVAKILEVDNKDIFIEFAGLNHLVWGKKVLHKGQDVTAVVLEKLADGAALSMKNVPDMKWDGDFLRAMGLVPCPYHRYYYMTDRLLEEEQEAAGPNGKGSRAVLVKEVERELFKLYLNPELNEKPKELEKRGGAYYSEAAISLISAIFNDEKTIHTVNIANNGAIQGLPNDSVVEINCVVGRNGAVPLNVGALPPFIAGLVQQVKAYEILAAEAGATGDRAKALLALVNNPLVPSVGVAKQLLEELLEINKEYLPQFFGPGSKAEVR
ncbi:MAG: 6-phospho-beta-glucosidase [Firmicutes bacterium]|nr:6-phospho-beta-glucosidase [Bacillota bacterium]